MASNFGIIRASRVGRGTMVTPLERGQDPMLMSFCDAALLAIAETVETYATAYTWAADGTLMYQRLKRDKMGPLVPPVAMPGFDLYTVDGLRVVPDSYDLARERYKALPFASADEVYDLRVQARLDAMTGLNTFRVRGVLPELENGAEGPVIVACKGKLYKIAGPAFDALYEYAFMHRAALYRDMPVGIDVATDKAFRVLRVHPWLDNLFALGLVEDAVRLMRRLNYRPRSTSIYGQTLIRFEAMERKARAERARAVAVADAARRAVLTITNADGELLTMPLADVLTGGAA